MYILKRNIKCCSSIIYFLLFQWPPIMCKITSDLNRVIRHRYDLFVLYGHEHPMKTLYKYIDNLVFSLAPWISTKISIIARNLKPFEPTNWNTNSAVEHFHFSLVEQIHSWKDEEVNKYSKECFFCSILIN